MTRTTRPVPFVLRHGHGDPRAVLARARAYSVDPEPEVWPRPRPAGKAEVNRNVASDPVGKRDMGQPPRISRQLPGPLVAEVCRNIDHVRGRFGAVLVGGWL